MSDTRLALLESGFGLGGYIPRAIAADAPPPSIPRTDIDRYWMAQAILEAMEGIGRTSPNPSVGAVIVKGEIEVSRGATEVYGSLHAERVALNAAALLGADLKDATCYATLEPCGGRGGKQPPCADGLVTAGLGRVVIGADDPHKKAAGLGLNTLTAAGITIERALSGEAKAWHFPFLAAQHKGGPVLIGKWAQTLDGHLADDHNNSQWISGPRSRAYTHWLRQKYDAIMVGMNTLLLDSPRLTARDSAPPHARQPHKIIFDPSARLATASSKVLEALFDSTSASGPIIYWCTKDKSIKLPLDLSSYADRLIHVPYSDEDVPLLFKHLDAKHRERFGCELQSVMVEGGAQLLTLLLRADLFDACHVFVRAGILGGLRNRVGRLERGDNPVRDLMERNDFHLLATQQIDDDVLIECVSRKYDFWKRIAEKKE